MSVNWTSEQTKAIEKTDCNLIVAAAAGSGKTAVLVEKIVNMIEHKTDVDRLLVTTFTDAAAKKMKQEISDEIKKRILSDKTNNHLVRQLTLLSNADICTIDSFCMKVVRSSFHVLGIDPDFKIADQNESELLRMAAIDEVFEQMYESDDEAFYNLLECYAGQRGDDALVNVVLSLHSFVRTMPDYKEYLAKCIDMYKTSGSIFESKWGKVVVQSTKIALDGAIRCVKDALEYASVTDEMSSYVASLGIDLRELENISDKLCGGNFDETAKCIREFKMAAGGRAKPKTPDEVKEGVVKNREYVKKQMLKLAQDFYYDSEQNIKEEMLYAAKQVEALCNVVIKLEEKFFEIKNKRGVLDFADIEHLALKALSVTDENGKTVSSEIAGELKEKYEMILIDEYQDSNELQETIFSRISRGDNIFMVGDLKQSIYRFRHTNPLLFKYKKDTYTESGINQRVIMSDNFRSRKTVVDFVNFIMSQISSQTVGEMEYDETERLNFGASYPDDDEDKMSAEIHIIDDNTDSDDDANEIVFGAHAEAVRIAKRILQLKRDGFEINDKKEGKRPLRYKDIVILMRSPSVDAQIFSDVLTSYGIPTFSDVGGGYFMTEEVELMLSLLSVIDNPIQDIKLLALMRSVIGNFDDNELLQIRLNDAKADIYNALCSYANCDDELGKKCSDFLLRINNWRKRAQYMQVHELISYLYEETGFYDYVGVGAIGKQRRANLDLLLEYARSFEKTSFKGLFNFINYAERIKGAGRDMGSAKLIGENQDVVRIMSIHKSKGLEFGVVFVTRFAKKFNTRDLSNNVLYHPALGIGVDYIDVEGRYKYPTFIKRAIKEKLRFELLSEELRVLYVALTRAREKLILTLAPSGIEAKKKRWISGAMGKEKNALPLYYTSSATGMSDWIMGALMRHEAFRSYAMTHISCVDTDAKIDLYTTSETLSAFNDDNKKAHEKNAKKDYTELIEKSLGYVYPYEKAKNVPTKISVTELKRISNSEIDVYESRLCGENMLKMPSFMSKKDGMDALERGSAMHFVMQNLDLSKALDKKGVMSQLEDMICNLTITKEQSDAVDAEKIASFFESELGRRMLKSDTVVRESSFEIALNASDVMDIDNIDEQILLQGIVDCYFYEDDEIVLLDYKTDYAKDEGDIEKIKNQYKLQLELYEKALEKITNKRVKEKYLYLFSLGSVVKY